LTLPPGESVMAIFPVRSFEGELNLVMVAIK
jgi:hypothetical protein